jgi:SEC-C motif-containing protein
MRSRYSAYAVGDLRHVFRTWHPRTRPVDLAPDPQLTWVSLEVLDATESEVEFLACFTRGATPGALHERSRFERRAGRWLYVDGDDLGTGTQPRV